VKEKIWFQNLLTTFTTIIEFVWTILKITCFQIQRKLNYWLVLCLLSLVILIVVLFIYYNLYIPKFIPNRDRIKTIRIYLIKTIRMYLPNKKLLNIPNIRIIFHTKTKKYTNIICPYFLKWFILSLPTPVF